jgi:ATP-binding protein involved in chromosome partitioning
MSGRGHARFAAETSTSAHEARHDCARLSDVPRGTIYGATAAEIAGMATLKEEVLAKLAAVQSPDGRPLTATGKLSDIVVTGGKVFFSVTVDAAQVQQWESVRERAEAAVRAVPGVEAVMIALTAERAGSGGGVGGRAPSQPSPASGGGLSGTSGGGKSESGAAAPRSVPPRRPPMAAGARPGEGAGHGPGHGPAGIPGVAAIIAVASGKGGVGKSTVAVNLALALREGGLKTGILDADIYGPSLPRLLAIRERPQTIGGTRLKPIVRHGMPVMSIGFLVEEETPMIWRGPMVMSALTQMLREVEWGELDVMVVDMPPGTGDAQLTMAQQVPLKGAVIVSTPQDLALIDARRGIAMFRRVNVPVIGIVENMSTFVCPQCGARSDIFGHGGARAEAERLGVPFLGEVPLALEIREKSDAGAPVVASAPGSVHARHFRDIAARVRDGLAAESRPAPKIVIEA